MKLHLSGWIKRDNASVEREKAFSLSYALKSFTIFCYKTNIVSDTLIDIQSSSMLKRMCYAQENARRTLIRQKKCLRNLRLSALEVPLPPETATAAGGGGCSETVALLGYSITWSE